MEFDKKMLEAEFQEYYTKHKDVATHVFTHSKEQDGMIKESRPADHDGKNPHVNGVMYSETRSRDSENKEYFEDCVYLCVGRYQDISRY